MVRDPHALVRSGVAGGPRPRPRQVLPLPDDVLIALLTAEDGGERVLLMVGEIVQELVFSHQMPPSFRYRMRGHEHPAVRATATGVWDRLTAEERQALLTDPHPDVRETA
ncbi:hypothetical protein ACFVJ8_25860 [Streptomyces yangpuensis]|uniref:hypothetical protein n=1 Tax=Streptomyces yangpuensis TaxID=1648182 RepID=UPI003626B5B6